MKKHYFTSLILISIMPFLTQCASQQEVDTLKHHVRIINKKLDDMKENTVGQMQQRQASSSGQLDQLQNDILQLNSTLDENQHMNRMLQEQNKELQLEVQNLSTEQEKTLNTKLAELDTKIATQKESLTAIQQARVQDAERRSKAAKKAADDAMRKAQQASLAKTTSRSSGSVHLRPTAKKVIFSPPPRSSTVKANTTAPPTRTSTKVSKPAAPVVATPAVVESVDTLGKAQQKYRDGKYKEAFSLFEENASRKGSNKTAITSRYMMGECLFKQGHYDQAIIQYQQIISNYPGNPQAAKALLRQGEAFEQLSDNETARIIYKKITTSYSSSPEAETAKKRISSL
ncbi:MAG: tetratricopeptide repeat protein [Thermodesulfobacteriota bacterium]|nr:tetratricopeptide repeat protein [Thermodesulfobacteriota bacterium]